MAENFPKMSLFLPKKAKHGRLAPDSTKPNGNALMGYKTVTTEIREKNMSRLLRINSLILCHLDSSLLGAVLFNTHLIHS